MLRTVCLAAFVIAALGAGQGVPIVITKFDGVSENNVAAFQNTSISLVNICKRKEGCKLEFSSETRSLNSITAIDSLNGAAVYSGSVNGLNATLQYDKVRDTYEGTLTARYMINATNFEGKFIIFNVTAKFDDFWDKVSQILTTAPVLTATGTTKVTLSVPTSLGLGTAIAAACEGQITCCSDADCRNVIPKGGQVDIPITSQQAFIYVKYASGAAAYRFGVLESAAILIGPAGTKPIYAFPVSLAGLFVDLNTASIAPGVISAFGESNRAVTTSTPNATVEVRSVRSQRVLLDDEYRNVSAGIVYAAVGSAFAFVLCLGAIAATLGGKAASKAAALA